jgi:hypothetical protein
LNRERRSHQLALVTGATGMLGPSLDVADAASVRAAVAGASVFGRSGVKRRASPWGPALRGGMMGRTGFGRDGNG